jgi:hypothetical protein
VSLFEMVDFVTLAFIFRKFATFVVNFKDLHDYQVIKEGRFDGDIKQNIEVKNQQQIKSLIQNFKHFCCLLRVFPMKLLNHQHL